jgi:hypothetical protein
MVSGAILVVAFAAVGVLAAVLAVAAFRRAGTRETSHTRDQGLSLRHESREQRF